MACTLACLILVLDRSWTASALHSRAQRSALPHFEAPAIWLPRGTLIKRRNGTNGDQREDHLELGVRGHLHRCPVGYDD